MIRFTFPSLFLYLLISRFHGSLAQLVVEVFKNSALVGPAAYSQNLSSLSNFSIFNPHRHEEEEEDLLFNFSARLQGTLDLTSVSEPFAINCIFFREEFSAALVWIDDHLVCQKGLYNISDSPNGAVFMMDGTVHTPLSRLRRASLLFRAHLWSSSTKAKGSIQWSLMNSSNKTMTTTTYTDIPKNLLHPSVSEPELKRMDMAETLNQGWGTWIHHSLLDFVLLPEGLRVSLQFCNQTACLDRAIPSQDFVRVTAPIASDFSFLRYHIMLAEQVKVSVTMSGKTLDGQDQLLIMVECATKGNSCEEYTLHFVGSIAYQPVRSGMVQKNGDNDSLRLVATGLRTVDLVLDTQSTRLKPPKSDNTLDRLVVPLPAAGEAVGLSSGDMPMSVSNMRLMLQALEHAERDKHQQAYPNNPFLSEVSMATQAAVMYNWIYTPAELSPLAPVSRGWNFAQTAYSSDFHYVIFNWDNVLASYMLTHSGGATKERAYSNLIQVVRSRTFKGFIPNFAAGGMKSQDRTEPPLGAKVLFEMYGVYRDRWIVELLWDDLADYMDWFFKARLLDGLLVLGSDTVSYEGGHAAHSMQGE